MPWTRGTMDFQPRQDTLAPPQTLQIRWPLSPSSPLALALAWPPMGTASSIWPSPSTGQPSPELNPCPGSGDPASPWPCPPPEPHCHLDVVVTVL